MVGTCSCPGLTRVPYAYADSRVRDSPRVQSKNAGEVEEVERGLRGKVYESRHEFLSFLILLPHGTEHHLGILLAP